MCILNEVHVEIKSSVSPGVLLILYVTSGRVRYTSRRTSDPRGSVLDGSKLFEPQ